MCRFLKSYNIIAIKKKVEEKIIYVLVASCVWMFSINITYCYLINSTGKFLKYSKMMIQIQHLQKWYRSFNCKFSKSVIKIIIKKKSKKKNFEPTSFFTFSLVNNSPSICFSGWWHQAINSITALLLVTKSQRDPQCFSYCNV